MGRQGSSGKVRRFLSGEIGKSIGLRGPFQEDKCFKNEFRSVGFAYTHSGTSCGRKVLLDMNCIHI